MSLGLLLLPLPGETFTPTVLRWDGEVLRHGVMLAEFQLAQAEGREPLSWFDFQELWNTDVDSFAARCANPRATMPGRRKPVELTPFCRVVRVPT